MAKAERGTQGRGRKGESEGTGARSARADLCTLGSICTQHLPLTGMLSCTASMLCFPPSFARWNQADVDAALAFAMRGFAEGRPAIVYFGAATFYCKVDQIYGSDPDLFFGACAVAG